MKLETFYITAIISILGSVGCGAFITALLSRRKWKAETRLADSDTQLKETQMYSTMLHDMQAQMAMQGQAIQTLQNKEIEYLKIINSHQVTERELRKRITQLEAQIKTLQTQYNDKN